MKILIVDDDPELRGLIGFALRQAGYLPIEAADGPSALAAYDRELPNLVLLDVNLPGKSGFEVLREIRERGSTPVMMLTVRSGEDDQVRGLDLGADDYLTKPFSPRTLLARVRAHLRRADVERPAPMAAGDLRLDIENQAVAVGGRAPVRLTNLEFRLLQYLMANAGHTLTTAKLTSHVWGFEGLGDRQILKQLVYRLRQKIETDPTSPCYLATVAGIGYALRPKSED